MPEPSVQRQAETESADEEIEEDEREEGSEALQAKPVSSSHGLRADHGRDESTARDSVGDVLNSPGEPLDLHIDGLMRSRLGYDFSTVRVHTNEKAVESARSVGALAYTVGRNVVFGRGQYAPETSAGQHLLSHELVHVAQQRAAEPAHRSGSTYVQIQSASVSLQRQRRPHPPTAPPPPARICGPNVTSQFRAALRSIETAYNGWPRPTRLRACARVLIPVTPGGMPDINGWDTLPLFQGNSAWLRTPPVYRRSGRGPCATPTSSDPTNSDPFAAGHEDPATCSNTVEFEGQCWLNGTVNYATFGVMVRLCDSDFTLADLVRSQGYGVARLVRSQARRAGASSETADIAGEIAGELAELTEGVLGVASPSLINWAEILIRTYKAARGSSADTADLPIAWVRAFSSGGSAGSPPGGANRPTCNPSCRRTGAGQRWSWVWEPVRPR